MAQNQVDLCGRESGSIWTRKITPSVKNGLLCEVSNVKTGLTAQGKHLQFSRVAFGFHGNWFVAGDHHGNVYHFDLIKNRFHLVGRLGHSVTSLACCIGRPTEILAALADYTIRCIDVESCEAVATLRGHKASVKSLSLHNSGRFCLAVSSRDAVLWDLDNFTRCRTLHGGQEVGVQDVFFQPLTNTILTCFKDDSIHAWEADSLDYKYQIPAPCGPAPHYRSFAMPCDGRLLVAGGRSDYIHVWVMDTRRLLRVVQLPSKIRVVKQLLFLPDNFDGSSSETVGFLAQDGILRVINIHSCKQLFQIGSQELRLSCAEVSSDGRYVAAVSEQGNLLIFDIETLSQDLNTTPAPLVRMVEGGDDEKKSSNRSTHTSVSKLKHDSSKQRHHTKPATRSDGWGQRARATPLIPGKARATAELEGEERGKEGESHPGKFGLDFGKLNSILRGYGEYPSKYRSFIWRCLLCLPENHTAYSSLLERGTHPAYLQLHQLYPIKSRKLLRVLQRALSALAHWSSIFGETEYLPGLVFPFVKLFQNNQLITFEILTTILMNWCGQWFEYFPNPPLNVLAMVENCLAHHDASLLEHFIKYNIASHQYAWPLMATMFSEVFSREAWLRCWDNILSNPPGFMLLVVVAYLIVARATLLQCSQQEDFEHFFHHPSSVDVGAVIQEAYHLQKTTPTELHPERMLGPFEPLTKGTYPVFNKYPKFIVDYQVQERERIRREEIDYLRERQSALELERLTEQRRQEEEAWYRQQKLLMEAEDQRRKMIDVEEKKLTDQRARLQALKREIKVKEIHVLDAARRRFMAHQQTVRESEIKKLDRKLEKRVVQREEETKHVLEDIEMRALELERQKALLEQELAKCQEEMVYRLRADAAAGDHRDALEQSMMHRAVEEDAQREREKLERAHTKLAKAQAERANQQALREADARRNIRAIHTDIRMEQVAEKSRGNRATEKEIQVLAKGLEEQHTSHTRMDHSRLAGNRPGNDEVGGAMDRLLHQQSTDTSTGAGTTGLTAATTMTSGAMETTSDLETPGISALNWSHRRDNLDQQEASLLAHVRQLRKKVAGQMNASRSSNGSAPLITGGAN